MSKTTTKASTSKGRGVSLHIGLNAVSAAAYGGWDGPLAACEFDANDMAAIAKSKGMKIHRSADEEGHACQRARGHPRRRQGTARRATSSS